MAAGYGNRIASPNSTFIAACLTALIGVVFAALAPPADAKPFPTDAFTYYMRDYDAALAKIAKTVDKPADQIRADADAAKKAGDARLAASALEKLVALNPKDIGLWLDLGAQYIAAKPINDQDGYEIKPKVIAIGLRAYLMATAKPQEAQGLNIAAQGFVLNEDWRPALKAYRESLKLVENADIRKTYEDLRDQHGFRITDYKIENDAIPPRACFELSDPASRSVTDFAPYFHQDPGTVSAVSVEGTRLCVEGLQYGQTYKVTVRKGLPSATEDALSKDYDYEFYVRDRSPQVRFVGKAFVLPRTGQTGIPLVSVNSKSSKLELFRVGDRNLINSVIDSNFMEQLSTARANDIGDGKGVKVWSGSVDTAAPVNQEVTTAVPVDEAMGKLTPGLYVMTAEPGEAPADGDYQDKATQWFVVSDLGLATMSGKDGLHAYVRSIATAEPVKNVELRLVARNNEVLATARTDDAGAVAFEPGLSKGEGGQAPALLVASSEAGDYGFVDLTQPAFDLTDRGVAGRDPPGAVDAFVYAERGVYRRGETVHVAALLRDEKANAMAGLPLTLVVERPDGVEYSRTKLDDQGAGGRALDIPISSIAAGGTWTIKAYTDPKANPVGQTTFLVEDYVPDRIEFTLKPTADTASPGAGARFAVDGRYLFGAPGAGLDLEANISVGLNETPYPNWKGYSFGLTDERVDTVQNTADNLPQTDISGHADLQLKLPDLPTTTRPLKADVAVRMREPGGRAVEQTATLPVQATLPLIGVKPLMDVGGAPEGKPSEFDVIAIDPAGKAIAAKGAMWTLKRLTTDWQWFNSDGDWKYEAVTRAAKVDGGVADISADKPLRLSKVLSWGEYRLEVAAAGMTPASVDFAAGYYYFSTSANGATPDTLSVAIDKSSVKGGDTLNVKIDSRFAGKATLQVVGDRVFSTQTIDVPDGGVSVPVKIGADWGTGAYVVATLYRPMDVAAKRMPTRSIGVAWFGIDRDARTLAVKLDAPAKMSPRGTLSVPVKIDGLTSGEEAYVTLAAVDVGILNLTRYKAPAPEDYYYDQKRLTTELRDIYGLLIDGMQGDKGRLRSGGDAGANFAAPPPTQPPLALFSGLVRVGADGTAKIDFDIPGFNGTVRLMAVAWSATKVGHAQNDVIVRDPVVVQGTLPRFLSVGDQSRFRIDLINAEAPAGDYSIGVTVEGPVKADTAALSKKVTLGVAGSHVPVNVPITATGVGQASLTARLVGPGNVVVEQTYNLHVSPANPITTHRTTMQLAARGGAITLTPDLSAEMVPGTASIALSVSPVPELDAAGLIRDLDRYPYGCSEQTVSRALPLLYLSDLKAGEGVSDAELQQRLADSVSKLVNRQSSNGAFGLWSAGSEDDDLWLSSFVTDFLLRAREKGFAVPDGTLSQALDYLRNTVGNAPDVKQGEGQDTAYALYVLARAGRAPVGDLKYLADTKIGDFGSPLARAQLGAALAILGDRPRAEAAFVSAGDALADAVKNDDRSYRSDYGSVLRDASAIVALATEAKATPAVVKAATDVIGSERAKSHYASTQDMTWMVLAARAIEQASKDIRLDVNGVSRQGSLYKLFADGELKGDYRVKNSGTLPLRAVVAVSGSPIAPEPEASNGLTITRKYFTQDGKEVDPSTVKQNTRLVVVIEVSAGDSEQDGDFLLADPLPAGFEIENPALVSSGNTGALSWLEETGSAEHTEFRDDRFIAAFGNSGLKVAYMVRAVSPGKYVHPGVTVEDMYRPEINARSATTTVTVTE